MSNKLDAEPSLDYYELRRKHQEYKDSLRKARTEADAQTGAQAEERTDVGEIAEVDVRPAAEEKREIGWNGIADTVEPIPDEDATIPSQSEGLVVEDLEYAGDGDEAVSDDGDQDDTDEGEAENPNPFDPFLRVFRNVRSRIGRRFGREEPDDEYEDEDDEVLTDDADGEALTDAPEDDANAPSPDDTWQLGGSAPRPAADPAVDEAVAEDIFEELPARRGIAPAPVDPDDEDEYESGDEDGEDDGDEEAYEDDEPDKVSGFKKFLRLFVVPIDEEQADDEDGEDEYGDEEDEEEASSPRRGLFRRRAEAADEDEYDEDDAEPRGDGEAADIEPIADGRQDQHGADEIEGGPDMSDLNNVNAELTNELAAELGTPGMSRRERRELALRQAAQKAAEEAQEAAKQAQTAAGDAAQAVQAEEKKVEAAVEKALEPDVIENVASGIVNIEQPAKDEYDSLLDEPTREYKAVSKLNLDEFMEQKKAAADEDDEDEEDDEEEEKPRRGLFGRRKRAEEDEDDEDEDDEDEDDEEEDVKPRRGLFGRRKRAEEDDEDEDDDEEDYDEDDENEDDRRSRRRGRRRYDEDDDDYDDDDYDDYDDYDDDEDSATFGHVLLGILKGFLTAVMLLLFVVVVLNVLNIFNVLSLENFARRLPDKMVNVLLPSENMKKRINVEAGADNAPMVQEAPVEYAAPEAPEAAPAAPEGDTVG